jgi:hypothetical protein
MTEPARSNVRILLPEQTRELRDLRGGAPEGASISDAPHEIVRTIAEIVGTKAALVGRDNGTWTVVAESAGAPPTPPLGTAGEVLDRLGDAAAVIVESWSAGGEDWTLVGLPRRAAPSVIMLHRDWTLSASPLRELG